MNRTGDPIIGLYIQTVYPFNTLCELIRNSSFDFSGFYFSNAFGNIFTHGYLVTIPSSFELEYLYSLQDRGYTVIIFQCNVYPKIADSKNVRTYEEFVNSECEMVILSYDWDLEIYCKNEALLLEWEKIACSFKGTKVIRKTLETDERKELMC